MTRTHSTPIYHSSEGDTILPIYTPAFSFEIEKIDLLQKTDPDYFLISPMGRPIRKIWMRGALISYEQGRTGGTIRIADPTGAVTFAIPQHMLHVLDPEILIPPTFLDIIARPEKNAHSQDENIQWIIENCQIATRQERDGWIIAAAQSLLDALQLMKTNLFRDDADFVIRQAKNHYHTHENDLRYFAETGQSALAVIKDPGPPIDPVQTILAIIQEHSGPKGICVDDIIKHAKRKALSDDCVHDTLRILIADDEVYQPAAGYIKLL